MRKSLLAMAMMLSMGAMASAATPVTYDITLTSGWNSGWTTGTYTPDGASKETGKVYGDLTGVNADDENDKATFAAVVYQESAQTPASDVLKYANLRLYKGSKLTIAAPDGYVITGLTFTTDSKSEATTLNSDCGGSFNTITTGANQKLTWTPGTEGGVDLFAADTKDLAKFFVKAIAITVEASTATPVAVEKPVITMTRNGNAFEVTMTCATEGAEIRYTTDKSEPTATSTPYTAAVPVTAKTVFKAIAVKGSDLSKVATFTANPPMVAEGFGPLYSLTETTQVIVNGTLTAVYQNGRDLYAKDSNDKWMLLYDSTDSFNKTQKYANGDTFDGVEGEFTLLNQSQPEITKISQIGEPVAGESVAPAVVTISDVTTDIMCSYVILENVKVEAAEAANTYTITDADGNTLTAYNKFYNSKYYTVPEILTGDHINVTGFVGSNKGAIQLNPVATVESPQEGKNPEAAWNNADNEAVTTVSVTFDKPETYVFPTFAHLGEGTVTYTSSDTEVAEIAADGKITVKAIGTTEIEGVVAAAGEYTEGRAHFTLNVVAAAGENQIVAEIDFLNQDWGVDADNEPITKYGKDNVLGAENFAYIVWATADGNTKFNTSVTIDKNTNYPAIVTGNDPKGLRIYGSSVNKITVNAPDQYKFEKAVFTAASATEGNVPAVDGVALTKDQVDGLTRAAMAEEGTYTKTFTEPVSSFVLSCSTETKNVAVSKAVLTITKINTAVDTLDTDNANAPVEYYNLQGVRVAEPTHGIFIRKQGTKATKVIF